MSCAGEADPAGGRRQDADQRPEQRGLAHAVVAEDADEAALGDREADPGQHRDRAVAGVQVFDLEHHATGCRPR